MNVDRWLASLGLAQYGEFFAANDIDLDALRTLTDTDLRELGVSSLGHRRKLLHAIATLGVEAPVPLSRTKPREAERRQLTVMFVDLVGSTALSARLDPEEMREVVRAYHGTIAAAIVGFDGYVAKLMGDGALAYFGWPRAHEDEVERAVRAGLAVVEAVGGLCTPDASALAARVGIATGTVVVGDRLGQGAAEEEAAIGETPNLAARLQDLAPPGGVVVADSTRRLLGRLFELDDLGARPLKGFGEPVRCFRVIRESGAEGRFEALHGERVTPLVGREHEIGLLLDRFARAREGDGQVVLLAGEPGLGKSRLVRALRNRLAVDAYTPLMHHCSPYHINTPLWPVIGLLERAAGLARDDSNEAKLHRLEALLAPHARDLGEATALIGALLGLSTAERDTQADLAPDRRKERTQEVLLDQVQGLAAERPLLCVYEDAHWMDPSTVELVGLVVERVQRLRAFVVVTFRPEFKPPWPHHTHVTQLSLARLTRRHAAAMVGHLTGGKALPPEVLGPIAERTDGVPLFVEELTKAVLESGLLQAVGDRFTLAGSLPPLAIPATLHDSLMARLDRFAPVKEVAQLGAAIGREFTYELLAAVATTREPALRDALAQLVAAELVFCRGHPPEATYVFKHALVQDAAYQSLLKSRRAQLHARIVRTIEQRFPAVHETQPELIAHHAAEAGLTDKAIEYWLAAGRRAASGWANPEAIAYLRRALDALAGQPETVERARRELEIQTTLAAPLIATQGFSSTEVEIAYSRAEQLAREVAHPTHLTTALRGLCAVNHVRAKLRLVERLGLELLGRVESESNPLKLADAHNAIAFDIFHLGRHRAARDHLKRSLDLISAAGDIAHAIFIGVDIRPFTRVYLAHCDWHLGYPDRALVEAELAIELARRLSDPLSQAVALDYAAMLHQFRREPRRVHERAEAALALCSERGFAYYRAWASLLLGWAEVAQGDVGQGLVRLQEGLHNLRATGAELRLPYYLGLLGRAQLSAGRRDEAAASLAEAQAIAERNAESWTLPELHLLEGDLMLAGAPPDEDGAAACFRRAAIKAAEQDAVALVLRASLARARLHLAQGQRAAARDLLAPVYASFTEGLDAPDLVEAKAILDAG